MVTEEQRSMVPEHLEVVDYNLDGENWSVSAIISFLRSMGSEARAFLKDVNALKRSERVLSQGGGWTAFGWETLRD